MSYTIPTEFRSEPYQNTSADRQTLFDAVWSYFITQGNPACFVSNKFGDKECRYRGNGDDSSSIQACAVGIFLPECDEMTSIFPIINQGYGIGQLFGESFVDPRVAPLIKRIFVPDLKPFLRGLQKAHDQSVLRIDPAQAIRAELINLATQEGLTIPA